MTGMWAVLICRQTIALVKGYLDRRREEANYIVYEQRNCETSVAIQNSI